MDRFTWGPPSSLRLILRYMFVAMFSSGRLEPRCLALCQILKLGLSGSDQSSRRTMRQRCASYTSATQNSKLRCRQEIWTPFTNIQPTQCSASSYASSTQFLLISLPSNKNETLHVFHATGPYSRLMIG